MIGIGLFDFVEGLIDHQILRVHHVKPGPNEFARDMGFLALGLSLVLIGWIIQRTGNSKQLLVNSEQ